MVTTLLLTTMLGSGMRSFAGSVRLRRNRLMRGSRRELGTKRGSTVIAIGASVMIGVTGISGSGLT